MSKSIFPTYWQLVVEDSETRLPLKDFLSRNTGLSLSDIEELIKFGSVHVEGKKEFNPLRRLKKGHLIRIYWPWHGVKRFYEVDERRILFEDKWLIAYNKEPGIPCQQTPSDSYNNVFSGLRRWLEKNKNQSAYLAMHHRLDQDTSGVILFSKSRDVNKELSEAFRNKSMVKKYLLWAKGKLDASEWVANQKIIRQHHRYAWTDEAKGKKAETFFRVLKSYGDKHLLLAIPKTGRTHQIRLHVQANGLQIYGDKIYGGPPAELLLLHAWQLIFTHPKTGKLISITAPIPEEWPPETFDVLQSCH